MADYPPQQRSMAIRFAPIIIALLMGVFMAVRGCQEGPFGRQQIVGMAPQEEAALGLQSFQQVLAQSRVIGRGPLPEAVTRIGRRLAEASESPAFTEALKLPPQKFEWDFRVVESDQVNAFCLPGGKVVVYTGIIPVAETDGGLATVLGHEIGHAIAHHAAERMAQQQLVQLGQSAVVGSMQDMNPRQLQQVMAVLGAGTQYGILLPFSRKHESEADHIGILLMAAAGYDPKESSEFWKRMAAATQGKGAPPAFMSTHPTNEKRIFQLKEWLAQAEPIYERSQKQDGERLLPGIRAPLQDDPRSSPFFPSRRDQ